MGKFDPTLQLRWVSVFSNARCGTPSMRDDKKTRYATEDETKKAYKMINIFSGEQFIISLGFSIYTTKFDYNILFMVFKTQILIILKCNSGHQFIIKLKPV